MKAMILAAGRGERLRPLTDHTPKPLLKANGIPLIEYTINALVKAGFTELVINLAHLGQQIQQILGNGERFGAKIQYSDEGEHGLETAGGIIKALPLLSERFLVVNADIATDYPYAHLKTIEFDLAYLVLVNNPPHHPQGDFSLIENRLTPAQKNGYTFSGIGVYKKQFFKNQPTTKRALRPLFNQAIEQGQVNGELYPHFWMDIGTVQRLKDLDNYYREKYHA